MLAVLFVWSGFGKILHFSGTLAFMESRGLPATEVLAVAAILIELGGGLMIAAGWKTRWATAAVLLFMVAATLIFHNPSAGQDQMIQFMKNLSIIGGLLVLFAFGPGRFSADRA